MPRKQQGRRECGGERARRLASGRGWMWRKDVAVVVGRQAAVGDHKKRKSTAPSNGGKCVTRAPNGGVGTLPGRATLYPSATGWVARRERRGGDPPARLVLEKWSLRYCWKLYSAPPRAAGRGGGASAAPHPSDGGSLETGGRCCHAWWPPRTPVDLSGPLARRTPGRDREESLGGGRQPWRIVDQGRVRGRSSGGRGAALAPHETGTYPLTLLATAVQSLSSHWLASRDSLFYDCVRNLMILVDRHRGSRQTLLPLSGLRTYANVNLVGLGRLLAMSVRGVDQSAGVDVMAT